MDAGLVGLRSGMLRAGRREDGFRGSDPAEAVVEVDGAGGRPREDASEGQVDAAGLGLQGRGDGAADDFAGCYERAAGEDHCSRLERGRGLLGGGGRW